MQKVSNFLKKIIFSYRKLPNKKHYVEFFAALLSIPMFISIILLNLANINNDKEAKPTEAPKSEKNIIVIPSSTNSNKQNTATIPVPKETTKTETIVVTQKSCKEELGPVEITSPQEGETVQNNPVTVNISYKTGEYCAAVWSHRINGGEWSEYDDKSVALYNLPQGNIKFELRVKSVASSDEETLTRNFTYNGGSAVTSTPTGGL